MTRGAAGSGQGISAAARLAAAAATLAAAFLVVGWPGEQAGATPILASTPTLAAPLPRPAIVAQGVSSANQAHLFADSAWDFATMRQAFNTVALLPGERAAVDAARRAGLAVVLEFDYKADFFAGRDISAKIRAVADQISDHPGTVSAVHVADRLNEKYSADEGLRYLAATGGVLHHLVPGVPVVVNAPDWQLTCGLPGQASCRSHGPRYQHETHATLDRFYRSGFVDGLSISNNLKQADPAAQRIAWQRARARWPEPFRLWTTCSQLSFGEERFPGTPDPVRATEAYIRVPLEQGAEAAALWAWHQLYDGRVHTFLDKPGTSNAMWAQMSATARSLVLPGAPPPPVAGRPATQNSGSTDSRQVIYGVTLGGLATALVITLARRRGTPALRLPHRRRSS